jgi:hypothetical protein
LAIATNLPEITSSCRGLGQYRCGVGNILGGIAIQTVVPGFDAFGVRGSNR